MRPGSPYYSDNFDMEGARALLVEARMLDESPHLPGHATLSVQGTDDAKAEKKMWIPYGSPIDIFPGTEFKGIFHDIGGVVRVVAESITTGGACRIEIRLTRLG